MEPLLVLEKSDHDTDWVDTEENLDNLFHSNIEYEEPEEQLDNLFHSDIEYEEPEEKHQKNKHQQHLN